jgi:signal transduction histidine kinase
MSLRRRIFLTGACALALPLAELALGVAGVGFGYRALFVLACVALIAAAGLRQLKSAFRDLRAVRRAIDDTARGEFASPIPVSRDDEVGALAEAVRLMRERLGEMSRRLVESLRIESLNILGSILVHDMKNLSFRLRALSYNIAANYERPEFRESLVSTLDDTSAKMDQMVSRFREQKEVLIVKLRININEVVRHALGNVRRDAAGVRITEEYAELPPIWADTMLIENAVYNIVDNARDAMPGGGQLTVRTRLIDDDGENRQQAIIEITDTGVGMSEEFITNGLFAPFVTTKPRGLGLGLYTCQQIIQMHDGEIKVDSEPGRGTRFTICLPITD